MFFSLKAKKIPVPPFVQEIAAVFQEQGKQAYLVGGAVRDLVRGKAASDWDIATDALTGEVSAMFRHVLPTGIKHGTVTVLYKGRAFEVTTFRTEADYRDGRRPDTVYFTANIEDDLARRDFTMNAIAATLPKGTLVDPFGGRDDIAKRVIRCVGVPEERFSEDGLRPLRALRFAATLGFSLDKTLLDAIASRLDVTARVSWERIHDEFEKIIMSPDPAVALAAMKTTGLLARILPELAACVNVEQKGYHQFDVFTHSVMACAYAAAHNMSQTVRLAALFHDIGKPLCARRDEQGIWTFYNHERESARCTRKLLVRLRFPSAVIDDVVHLIEEHMFNYDESWSAAAVRRFLIRVGEEHLSALFALRAADSFGTAGHAPPPGFLAAFQQKIDLVRAKSSALSLKSLAVNGRDLIALGIPAGRRLGVVLHELLNAVLEDPALNTREKLLEIARNFV